MLFDSFKHIMSALIRNLIAGIGDDPTRHGLELTPERVVNVNKEVYYGYVSLLSKKAKSFSTSSFDINLVYIKDAFFSSNCEHHMMPFFGVASLVYVPAGSVIGLSKLVSVLNYYSARLQSQERLTFQVLNYIKRSLRPKAVFLKLECKHMCMMVRGVKSVCANTGTVVCAGMFNLSDALLARSVGVLAT
ncbi:GTP cyclohydrolase I FolE [Candidatus Hodgkinia cicadicola]